MSKAKTKAIDLTQDAVAALPYLRTGKTRIVRDRSFPNFVVNIGRGTKSFALLATVDGKPRQFRCGDAEFVTVDEAKRRAREKQAAIITTPKDADALTLRHAWNKYRQAKVGGWAARTEIEYDNRFEYLASLADVRLTQIKRSMAAKLFADLTRDSGKFLANHVMRLATAVWNYHAGTLDHDEATLHANPFATAGRNKLKKRDCSLNEKDMPKLFASIMKESAQHRVIWLAEAAQEVSSYIASTLPPDWRQQLTRA